MLKIDQKRHLLKTITWRTVGTIDTMLLGWFISGDPTIGLSIGGFELITKMTLYYFHERAWYRINWGIQRPRKSETPINWFPENGHEKALEKQTIFLQDESEDWIKRAKVTQSITNTDQYTVHLSFHDKKTGEKYADVYQGSKQNIEQKYNIKIN